MRSLLAALVALGALTSAGAAQWRVGLEFATTRYRGTSRAASDTEPTLRPGATNGVGVRVDRSWGRWGLALRVAASKPGLEGFIQSISLVDRSDGRALEPSVALAYRVGGIGPSGAVLVEVGPALPLWDIDGEIRYRWGALGAVVYEWTVAGRFGGAVRADGMVSPSWFKAGDLPPELERSATWRYGVGIGLRYRL